MLFIKSSFIILLFFSVPLFCFGQSEKFQIKIIDSENGAAISNVLIISKTSNDSIYSNTQGYSNISKLGVYIFQKSGYLTKTVSLKKNIYEVIQMTINPSDLKEVIINANHIPQKLLKATTSIDIVSTKDIERGNNTDFSPILNRVPGVFMQSGALNTNRITIRGIGSRNLFGTSKIRAYFKDIPLTNGTGETAIEDFELGSISRFEIIKGTTSSIYGAGLGGTIHLIPENAYLNQSSFKNEISVGSFGLIKGIVNVNHGNTLNSFRMVYSNTHSDGYRENNTYNRQTFTLTTNHFLSEKDELSVLASYVDLKAFIPSSINETAFLNNPKSAALTWKESKGFEDTKRGILGVSWQHDFQNNLKQTTSFFSSFTNAYEPRPFNILTENTLALGVRSRLLKTATLFNKNLQWTLGGELFKDTYKNNTFENLYQDFELGTGSVQGDKLSDFKEKRSYYNLFFEINYEASQKTTLCFGLNFNETSYNLEDQFTITPENPDQSGSFKFKNMVSPKFGVSYVPSKNINIYSNISHGFSPISLNETLLPNGQINTNLRPETGWNYEIGSRGSFMNNHLDFHVSLFRLDIKNLIVARRTAEDAFIGINAGSTQHDGLEVSLNYKVLEKSNVTIGSFITYTLNQFTFKEFIDGDTNFSGNDLTGVPSNILNAGLDVTSKSGIYGNVNHQYVGSMPITDSNSLYIDSYNITNFKIGYKTNLNKKINLNAFLGINNIFDTRYASQILINATGFGSSAPRYYYPGNPINYFTGLNISYMF